MREDHCVHMPPWHVLALAIVVHQLRAGWCGRRTTLPRQFARELVRLGLIAPMLRFVVRSLDDRRRRSLARSAAALRVELGREPSREEVALHRMTGGDPSTIELRDEAVAQLRLELGREPEFGEMARRVGQLHRRTPQ
jgi:hypothetical protein